VAERASFLLPKLRPGMRLLDCGCGPGSLTVGLAKVVAPGRTIGVDVAPRQIARAERLAMQQRARNVSFGVANVYDLPFPEMTFDVVFAHNLLEHLRDPLRALREMRRVLKPGGLVAVRDPDHGALVWAPGSPLLDEASRLLLRIREHLGGSPYYARHLRQLLLEAGFVDVDGFAFAEYQGNAESTRAFADVVVEVLSSEPVVEAAVVLGWCDRDTMRAMCDEVRAWGDRPDAFRALVDCAALGWVDDAG
jgi:ubiquinone/menaquinone biosynthesis C-methylase UbiE